MPRNVSRGSGNWPALRSCAKTRQSPARQHRASQFPLPSPSRRQPGTPRLRGWLTAYELPEAVNPGKFLQRKFVYDLLGDGVFLEEYTGIHSWVENLTRYTVVHSRSVAVLFVDTRPVDAIVSHHDLLGVDDPKSFFTIPG
jgi:hypothetical protein